MVYVANANGGTVTSYSLFDSGDAKPQTILMVGSHLLAAVAVAISPSKRLYVCCGPKTINVYDPNASGDATPLGTVGCGVAAAEAFAVNRSGDVFIGVQLDELGFEIQTLDEGFGCVATSSIAGPHTDINAPAGIDIDADGYIYASNSASDFGEAGITVHAPTATGDAAPVRFISGPNTGLVRGFQTSLTLDERGQVYVLAQTQTGGCLLVFAHDAAGDAIPLRRNCTVSCGLANPFAIAADRHGNIYAVNANDNSITVYQGSSLKPLRVIKGPHTGLNRPQSVAVLDP